MIFKETGSIYQKVKPQGCNQVPQQNSQAFCGPINIYKLRSLRTWEEEMQIPECYRSDCSKGARTNS